MAVSQLAASDAAAVLGSVSVINHEIKNKSLL